MATTMAATRQPFAPLNSSRLQTLVSVKNRQNALTSPQQSSTKRKASTSFDTSDDNYDAENIDPSLFLFSPKRSKCPDGTSKPSSTLPTNFFLKPAPPSPNFSAIVSPQRKIRDVHPRTRIDTKPSVVGASLSAPAGRSPTRKRIGILNRKRGGVASRVEPPRFAGKGIGGGLGFSIDAALSGTIPDYSSRQSTSITPASAPSSSTAENGFEKIPLLYRDEKKESWFFDIHEDTEEELATNLMEHSTCTLDISSDEESRVRERDNRGKENIAPFDDVSQTSSRRRMNREEEIEVDRAPLGDLKKEDFFAEGCGEGDCFLVAEEEETDVEEEVQGFEFSAEVKGKGKEVEVEVEVPQLDIDTLMSRDSLVAAPKAALLQPIEKAEEGFELWESGSAKDGE